MSLVDHSHEFDGLQEWLRPYAFYACQWFSFVTEGQWPTVTSVYRDITKQQELYDDRANNPYPVNRPGDSAHQWGLAFDSSVRYDLRPLWTYIRRYVGFRVPENDVVHAEVPNWRDIVRAGGYKIS